MTRRQLLKLDAWLHELLAAVESKKPNSNSPKRQVLKKHTTANKTYQLETVREEELPLCWGELHGSYWYAY